MIWISLGLGFELGSGSGLG